MMERYFNGLTEEEEKRKHELLSMDIKDIAKLIRKELKKEFGKDIKFSVTIHRYSGGQSLNIKIKQVNKNLLITQKDFDNIYGKYNDVNAFDYDPSYYDMISKEFNKETKQYYFIKEEVLRKIKTIGNMYNYDYSCSMVDYFDVNYYLHVGGNKVEVI